jgi:prolyl 4-hydroxylase
MHMPFTLPGKTITTLSQSPYILIAEDFLSEAECAHIITLSEPLMQRSQGYDLATGNDRQTDIRTSFHAWLGFNQDATITAIEERIAEFTDMPIENGEEFSIIRYQLGQKYETHHDYFDPQFPGSARALSRGGQRKATAILYLNDVEAGGQTFFPRKRLTIPPKKGSLLYFTNIFRDGGLDADSFHAGLPVEAGEKWIATKWLRLNRFQNVTEDASSEAGAN